ncbi:MAG TPA: sialate O-acetylesterase [Niabella sp.]|nr:sialate O-acetylesterase [Niabella sp.]
MNGREWISLILLLLVSFAGSAYSAIKVAGIDQATLPPNAAGTKLLAKPIAAHFTGNLGGLQLPPVFSDNMVLQRKTPIPFWGIADANELVTVQLGNLIKNTKARTDGRWQIIFPAQKATYSPLTIEIKTTKHTQLFKNVLIGDVWLCAGQSNMYFPLKQSTGGDSIINLADSSLPLRLFNFKQFAQTENRAWDSIELLKANQLDFFSGQWQTNQKAEAASFSAIGYVFGKKIMETEKIPVGMIEIAVGGSPLISWVSRKALENNPLFAPAFQDWRNTDFLVPWCRSRADVNLQRAKNNFQRHTYEPSYNFEAALKKIIPFPVKGVLWYQGESDAENAGLFEQLFPLFVQDWRTQWDTNLPFYYVQLSGIDRPAWNHFRDLQRRLLRAVPNTGMVVSSDCGDSLDVHYKNKIPVGERLSRLALADTYKWPVTSGGPLFTSAVISNRKIIISFQNANGLKTADGKAIRGFEILTHNGNFIKADAVIQNNKIIIPIPWGITPEKIAYAWQPFTRANLVNEDLLPASTFIETIK